jgi:hypothetical protein
MRRVSVADRLEKYTEPEPMSGCWLWTGGVTSRGYPSFTVDGKAWRVNRWTLSEKLGRPLLDTEMACHRCDMPLCVNPAHLFLGDGSVNQLDSVEKRRQWQARKTHCPKGHDLTGENLQIETRGGGRPMRRCRACRDRQGRIESWTPEQRARANEIARASYHRAQARKRALAV